SMSVTTVSTNADARYWDSSTRLGSTMRNRTVSGVARAMIVAMATFRPTDLPEPVTPAYSAWGAFARSMQVRRPSWVTPTGTVSVGSVVGMDARTSVNVADMVDSLCSWWCGGGQWVRSY